MNTQFIHTRAISMANRYFRQHDIADTRENWCHWQKLYGSYVRLILRRGF